MQFLVLMHPAPGADPAKMGPILPAETRHAWAMYRSGVARQLYMRADGKGAVLFLECADAAEAERHTGELPLVQAGLARAEIVALAPFTPFESLFGRPAS